MARLPSPHRRYPALVALAVIIGLASGIIWLLKPHRTEPVDSYAQCVAAGYPVTESEPPVCRHGDRSFTGPHQQAPATTAPAASQSFELLVSGDSHGDYPSRQEVIQTPAQWQHYWAQVHQGLTTLPPLIPVDFSQDTVVALSYGQKPTGGYGIKVSGVMVGSSGTVVDVTQSVPGEGCVVTAALTNPYYLIRTAKLSTPVSFRTTTQRHTC